MRVAFYALLLMNLAYFAWAHWVDAPRAAPVNETIAHLPQLKLVDELSPAERPQPHTAQKTSLDSSASCVSVGPFADLASSSQGAAILRARGFEPRQRAEQSPAAESYWVYVAGLSQAEADRALVALEHGGIHDARVMPDNGGTTRRLSLGLYSERPRAERRAEAVRQAGLEAEIAARRTTGTVYFLDLTASGGVDAIPLQELAARAVTSRIALQPCPSMPGAAGLD
ncbi:MAG TPA: hypothetical protein VMT66_04135 [Steroidobacteraceae bacterium]|nr:hypothetical protein [Steroidobacteraceae bacterium]